MTLQVSPVVVAKVINFKLTVEWRMVWITDLLCSGKTNPSKLVSAAVQKKGYMDFQELAKEENVATSFGNTLQKDSACSLPCSWATADPTTFLIRGENYFKDNLKVP